MKPVACLLVATVLILAGCSSTPARVDRGPITARTFSFVNPGTRPVPPGTDQRQEVHRMIQEAITANLSRRGVMKTEAGGEVTVGYLVIVGNNASTALISDYFGYGEDSSALHEKAQAAYTKSKNPNYFEAGTLVIDVIDSRGFKLVKRGYATRPLLRDLPTDGRAARIQEVVDEILRDLRITP